MAAGAWGIILLPVVIVALLTCFCLFCICFLCTGICGCIMKTLCPHLEAQLSGQPMVEIGQRIAVVPEATHGPEGLESEAEPHQPVQKLNVNISESPPP